jgi:hypothetical protein
MANYNKATNFTAKDTLPTGNAGKIIKGTEIDNEFTAIASAITSKADSNSPALTGTPTVPTASLGTNTTQIASTAFIKAAIDALLPTGVITMWSGAITSIPTGWYLCDGQNSTPDLRGKFIIGAGATSASVTGSAGASVTGSISGATLTVSAVASGTIAVGDIVSHSSILETATITGLGTGTGGTLMGAGETLKNFYYDMEIVAVEPSESPVMSGGESGLHGIQGIGDGSKFMVDLDFVDHIITISTEEATQMSRRLSKDYGIFVGISAGANVLASVKYGQKFDKTNIFTILCDRGDRYLSIL